MVSRADLTCHNCNTTGLEERSRTADQFGTDRKELIYATKCPDCGERVDPAHIRQQLPEEPDAAMSTTEQLVEYTKSLSIRTAATVVGVFLLVVALSITGLGSGGSLLSPGEETAAQSPDTAVLTGTIEGPNGDGLDNATVSVVGNDLSTATDSDGSYRLDSVPTGSQALVVTTPGSTYPNLTREVSVSESESPVTEYYTVEQVEEVSTAETSDGESVETSDGGSTATLIGTVENGAGESIDDAAVAVDGPDSFDETVDTGSDGRYRVNDVPSGDVDIEVSHNDYDTASRQISVSGSDSTVEEYFELEAESEPDADVTLVGTVENDSSGAAIDDATVRVADDDIDDEATTDSEGQYRLTGLPTGEYEVVVEHPQYESYRTTLDPSSADASLTGYYELDHKVTEWATTLSTASSGVPNRTSDRIELADDPPATQTVTIASPVTTERVTMGDTARGRQELVLPGNRMPTNMTLTISGEASTSNETVTAAVGPNTTNTTLPVAVDGDLPTNVTVEIEPTTNTTAASAAGTVAPGVEAQTVSLAGNGDIDELTATVRGVENLTAHNQSTTGDSTLPVTYRGNEPAVGANGTGQPTLTITGAGAAPTTTGANGTANPSSTISLSPDGQVTGTPEIVVEGTNTTGNTTTVPLLNESTGIDYQGNLPPVGVNGTGEPVVRVTGTEAAEDTINESGRVTSSNTTATITDLNLTGDISGVNGNENPEIDLTAQTTEGDVVINSSVVESGNSTNLTVRGNTNTTVTIELLGNESTGELNVTQIQDGGSFKPVGNKQPAAPEGESNLQLVIEGAEQTLSRNKSTPAPLTSGEDLSFDVGETSTNDGHTFTNGKADGDAEVIVEGVDNSTTRSEQWNATGDITKTFDVDGSTNTTAVEINITGSSGDGSGDTYTVATDNNITATASNPTAESVQTYIGANDTILGVDNEWNEVWEFEPYWTDDNRENQTIQEMIYAPSVNKLYVSTKYIRGPHRITYRLHAFHTTPDDPGTALTKNNTITTDSPVSDMVFDADTNTLYTAKYGGDVQAYNESAGDLDTEHWTHSVDTAPPQAIALWESDGGTSYITSVSVAGGVQTFSAAPGSTPTELWDHEGSEQGIDATDKSLSVTSDTTETMDTSDMVWGEFIVESTNGVTPYGSGSEASGGPGKHMRVVVNLENVDSVTGYGAHKTGDWETDTGYREWVGYEDGEETGQYAGAGGASVVLKAGDGSILSAASGGGGGGDTFDWDYNAKEGGDGGGVDDLIEGGAGGADGNDTHPEGDGKPGRIWNSDQAYILGVENGGSGKVQFVQAYKEFEKSGDIDISVTEDHVIYKDTTDNGLTNDMINVLNRVDGTSATRLDTGFGEEKRISTYTDNQNFFVIGDEGGTPTAALVDSSGNEVDSADLTENGEISSISTLGDGQRAVFYRDGTVEEFELLNGAASISGDLNDTSLDISNQIGVGNSDTDEITVPTEEVTLDLDMSGGANVTATWTETTETIDPELTVENESGGTQVIGGDTVGTVSDGTTTTLNINESLLSGGVSINVTNVSETYDGPAGQLNTTVKWDETRGVEQAEASAASITKQNNTVLYAGENATFPISGVGNIEYDTTVTKYGGPQPNAYIKYRPAYITESPGFDITGDGNKDEEYRGKLTEADNDDPPSYTRTLEPGKHTITWLDESGGRIGYNISYTPRISTSEVSITDNAGDISKNITDFAEPVALKNMSAETDELTIETAKTQAVVEYALDGAYTNATPNITVRADGEVINSTGENESLAGGETWNATGVPVTEEPNITVSADGGMAAAELIYRPRNVTENVTVSTDTNTTTVAVGELAAGETANTTLPGIDSDTEIVTIHAAHAPADYNLTLTSGTATHNVSVTDANGSTIVHRDRPLPSGENMTVDVPISSNRTFHVTADGNTNYTSRLAYQARNATKNVAIETTGDSEPEVDTDAISPGSATTYTVPVNASNATISAAGPVAYQFNYSATNAPEDVALTAGNTTQQLNGTVTTDRTVTLQDIEPGTDELRVDAAHSGMNVSAAWVERSGTVDPTITHVGTGEVLCRVEGPLSGTHNCSLPNDASAP